MARGTEDNLEINTFNTHGLGDKMKRRVIFEWLKTDHKGITCLQEVVWKGQWDGDIIFSHGTSRACGVAILLPSCFQYKITDTVGDEEGRLLLLDIDIDGQNLIFCNVYAPTKDVPLTCVLVQKWIKREEQSNLS